MVCIQCVDACPPFVDLVARSGEVRVNQDAHTRTSIDLLRYLHVMEMQSDTPCKQAQWALREPHVKFQQLKFA